MIILPAHDNGICFHLLYLLQFLSALSYNFPSTGLLHPWLGLFLGILFPLKQLWMGLFLVSLSVSSLMACKNAIDIQILILYLITLLNSFIVLLVSWCNLWGSLCRVSYPLQIKTVLFFTCQFECLLFLLLIWLLWLGLPSSTMLNKRGESGHPCLVLDLKWNTCSFWVLSMMLAVGLSYMAFIMFRYVPTNSTLLRVFIINQCWILPNAFSASIDIHLFLSFILFVWCITFWFVVPTLCSWNQSRLIMLYDLLDALLYLVC